jgi:hypothetical protein
MVTAGIVHSLLVIGLVALRPQQTNSKGCANCRDAHPFIKSSQEPVLFQSIPAADFGDGFSPAWPSVKFKHDIAQSTGIIHGRVRWATNKRSTNKF